VAPLIKLPPAVYGYGMILAVFGTVAPALLLSHGLKRAGAQNFSVISAIGPVFFASRLKILSPTAIWNSGITCPIPRKPRRFEPFSHLCLLLSVRQNRRNL
jgi:hypothetical protein